MEIVIFTGLQVQLQACWKVGVLQPPSFTMPKSGAIYASIVYMQKKKGSSLEEMYFFP